MMLSLQSAARRIIGTKLLCRYSSFPSSIESIIASNAVHENGKKSKIKKPEPIAAFKNDLISSAFDTIKGEKEAISAKFDESGIDAAIDKSKTLSEMLEIAARSDIQRNQALRIVSKLSDWAQAKRIKLSDFETDARFLSLCRSLGRNVYQTKKKESIRKSEINAHPAFQTEDLSLVMGVAGDDEAAKLVSSISLPQMVMVLTALAQKKRRSTPLLRSLAHNISSSSGTLDLKQCADVLFGMASLNFVDTVLMVRVGADIQSELPKNIDRPAAVGSIITSLGLLKHKDTDLIDLLTGWMIMHSDICRPEDLSSLFHTLATINYPTVHAEELKNLVNSVQERTFARVNEWLNFVWSLAVLDLVSAKHIDSVLSTDFIEQLVREHGGDLSSTTKMKLMNINAAAHHLIPNYEGAKLSPNNSVFRIPIAHSKNKSLLASALNEALRGLFNSESYLRKHVNTGMGFIIDAECVFDRKLKPLAVDGDHEAAIRCALIVQDFHDFCTGAHNKPTGISAMTIKLLEKSGYKVLVFPHFEFNSSDNLLKRVKYLESKFKTVLQK